MQTRNQPPEPQAALEGSARIGLCSPTSTRVERPICQSHPKQLETPAVSMSLFFPPLAEAGPGCPGCPGCGLRRSAEPVSSATSSGRSLDGPGRPAIASNPFPFLVQDLTQHGQCPRQRDSRAAGLCCVLQRPDLLLACLLNSFLDATAAP